MKCVWLWKAKWKIWNEHNGIFMNIWVGMSHEYKSCRKNNYLKDLAEYREPHI